MSRKSCLIRLFKTTVSCKLFTAIILSVFLVQPALTYAGVVIGGTRVVYLSNNPDKSISVFSKEEKIPYLIQAWVDPFNKEDKSKAPFTVIPPVSRLEPAQEKVLRIIHTKGVSLPDDRESVFWLNIKNIPPSASNKAANSLEIAVKTRIKLFLATGKHSPDSRRCCTEGEVAPGRAKPDCRESQPDSYQCDGCHR